MTTSARRGRPRWLGLFGLLLWAVACGTALQSTGPTASGLGQRPSAAAVSVAPAPPDCPDDAVFQPAAGCVFEAAGSPPGAGTDMRPIPDGDVGEEERARHVRSFWMDARRVRVGEYRARVGAGTCVAPKSSEDCAWGKPGADDKSMTCVRFEQAQAYCSWVKKRLLTDDEWERALQNHAAFGITELGDIEPAEWTSTYYCDEQLSSCGYARATRGGDKPETRGWSLGTSTFAWQSSAPGPRTVAAAPALRI